MIVKASATTTTYYDENLDFLFATSKIPITTTMRPMFRSKSPKTPTRESRPKITSQHVEKLTFFDSMTITIPSKKASRTSTPRIVSRTTAERPTVTTISHTEPFQIVYDRSNLNLYGNNYKIAFESEQKQYNDYTPGHKVRCFSILEFGNMSASPEDIIRYDCSMFKKNYSSEFTSGSVYYLCGNDGKFVLLNSTCTYNRAGLLPELSKRVIINWIYNKNRKY